MECLGKGACSLSKDFSMFQKRFYKGATALKARVLCCIHEPETVNSEPLNPKTSTLKP